MQAKGWNERKPEILNAWSWQILPLVQSAAKKWLQLVMQENLSQPSVQFHPTTFPTSDPKPQLSISVKLAPGDHHDNVVYLCMIGYPYGWQGQPLRAGGLEHRRPCARSYRLVRLPR